MMARKRDMTGWNKMAKQAQKELNINWWNMLTDKERLEHKTKIKARADKRRAEKAARS